MDTLSRVTDLLVAVGRERHGEPPAVLGEERRLLQLQPAARGRHDEAVLAVGRDGLAHTDHAVVLVSVLPGEGNLPVGRPGDGVDVLLSVVKVTRRLLSRRERRETITKTTIVYDRLRSSTTSLPGVWL